MKQKPSAETEMTECQKERAKAVPTVVDKFTKTALHVRNIPFEVETRKAHSIHERKVYTHTSICYTWDVTIGRSYQTI